MTNTTENKGENAMTNNAMNKGENTMTNTAENKGENTMENKTVNNTFNECAKGSIFVAAGVVFLELDAYTDEVAWRFANAQASMEIAEEFYAGAFRNVMAVESARMKAQEEAAFALAPEDVLRAETDLAYAQRECEEAAWVLWDASEIYQTAREEYTLVLSEVRELAKYAQEAEQASDLCAGCEKRPACR